MKCPLNQTYVQVHFWLFLILMFILNLINTLSVVESNILIINEKKINKL